jgi:transcriptional regulator with XRE-family HTH domain
MKNKFNHIGKLIKHYRLKSEMPQIDIANKLGFKNAQFISNVERGKASIPLKKIAAATLILGIPPHEIIEAMAKDYSAQLWSNYDLYIKK